MVLTTWRSVGPEMTGKHGEEHVPVPRRQSGTTQRGSERFSRAKFVHRLRCLVCCVFGGAALTGRELSGALGSSLAV